MKNAMALCLVVSGLAYAADGKIKSGRFSFDCHYKEYKSLANVVLNLKTGITLSSCLSGAT